jgi:glycosyltransferase involved in cell wall biosynthesis
VTAAPDVAILLCTYNGGRHLQSQLDTFAAQSGVRCRLLVSDDGSYDDTLPIVKAWAVHNPDIPVTLRNGPRRGHAANFLSALCDSGANASYYAFADQDDLWDSDKLSRAVARLEPCSERPAMYCGRTRSISEAGTVTGLSPLFSKPPAFRNALIHNIGGGNTMVLNQRARDLLVAAGEVDVVAHDWWSYLLVSGAGGTVIYDPEPRLGYRQHDDNAIGANTGARRRVRRYAGFLGGRNRAWTTRNVSALESNVRLLSPENRTLMAQFDRLRHGNIADRLRALRDGGFYAQTWSANVGLWFATLLKKI